MKKNNPMYYKKYNRMYNNSPYSPKPRRRQKRRGEGDEKLLCRLLKNKATPAAPHWQLNGGQNLPNAALRVGEHPRGMERVSKESKRIGFRNMKEDFGMSQKVQR